MITKLTPVFAEFRLEPDEREIDVLRAIARTIYELSLPVDAKSLPTLSHELTDEEIAPFTNLEAGPLAPVLTMGETAGRRCSAQVFRLGPGVLGLFRETFEKRSSLLELVVQRAKDFHICYAHAVSGQSPALFESPILDERLACYGFTRQAGERSWAFRRRVFPELWSSRRATIAIRFLLGGGVSEMTAEEAAMLSPWVVRACGITDPDECRRRAQSLLQQLTEDPLVRRQRRAAPRN